MASPAQDNRKQFADTFNRLMQGNRNQKAYTDKSYEKINLAPKEQYAASKGAKPKLKSPVVDKPVNKQRSNNTSPLEAVEREQFLSARQGEMQKESEDQPWYKDVLNKIERPLDLLSRTGRTIPNAMGEVIDSAKAGEPFWSIGDDVIYGGWRGLSGQSKRGFGDVFQDLKDLQAGEGENSGLGNRILRGGLNASPQGALARGSNELEDKFGNEKIDATMPFTGWKFNVNPATALDRGVGLTGDVAFDPATYVGIGVAARAVKGTATFAKADDLVRNASRAVDKMNDAASVASKARKLSNAGVQQKAADTAVEAKKLMAEVRAKYPDVIVPDEQFTTRFVKTGGSGGTDAYRSSIRSRVSEVGDDFPELKNPLDKEAARTVQRVRLIDDLESGAINQADFLDEYAKVTPSSKVMRDLKAGKITADDAATSLKAFKPVLTPDTLKLARAPLAAIEDAAVARLEQVAFDINAGGLKGKMVGTPRDIVPAVANTMTEEFKHARIYASNKKIKQLQDHFDSFISTKKRKLSTKAIDDLANSDPMVRTWLNGYLSRSKTKGPARMQDQAMRDGIYQANNADVARSIETELLDFHAKVMGAMTNSVQRVPMLRVLGRDVKALPGLGNVGRKVGDTFNASRFGESFNKAFRYSSNNPGYTTYLGNKSQSLGVRNYEKFKKEVSAFAKQMEITREEAKVLHVNLETGRRGTGRMADAYDFLKRAYDEIYAEEIAAGIRDIRKNPKITDYAYTHIYPKRSRTKIAEAVDARFKHANVNSDLNGFHASDIKAKGHKVEEDAFTNLMYRRMKSNRELTKAYFYRDLVTHYGIKASNVSKNELTTRGLVPIKKMRKDYILDSTKDVLKPGENLYLDKKMAEVFSSFEEMQKNSDEIIRALDFVTRKFKTWNTIYFPGYHVRNMIGDMFMGAIDGVKTRDYSVIAAKWFKRDTAMINVGGENVRYADLYEAFDANLSSGTYVDAELLGKQSMKKLSIPAGVRKLSEGREDFGRFVHFYRAMNDEYAALLKKGVNKDVAWESAINSSMARVNHFKFDYRALTPFETKYMRRGIPFYTYTRKAVPTLLESLMLQPKYLVTLNRWQEDLADRYDMTQLTDWMRDFGYMKLTDDWGITDALLPTAVLKDAFSNPIDRINPIGQIPIEAKTGEDLFSGRPVEGMTDILMNKWRGFGLYNPMNNKEGLTEREDKTTGEKILRIAGIPVNKFDDKEKNQVFTEIRYKLVGKLNDINASLEKKGFSIFMSERNDGMSIKIRDKVSGQIIWEGESLAEAQKRARSL